MIPSYTCLEQSAPAIPTRQSSILGHPQIAHRLYSITTATYKHPEAIMHSKQKLQIRTVQQHTIKMKSLENESTSRYEHTDAKITKIGSKTEKL